MLMGKPSTRATERSYEKKCRIALSPLGTSDKVFHAAAALMMFVLG